MSHCSAIIIQLLQSLVIVWSCTTAQLWQPISAWLSFLVCLFPFLWNYCTLLLLTALSASCRISAFLVYSTAFYLHLSKHKKWSTPWTPNQNNTVGLISLSHFDMIFTVNWVWRSSLCIPHLHLSVPLPLSLCQSWSSRCCLLWFQIAPNVVLTDEEIEMKQKQEYHAYQNEEYSFLRELGLLKEDEEPLPEV